MPTKERTPDQTAKQVSAAFDSVNLITRVVLDPATDKTKAMVDRNMKHLELMLTKDWFTDALTTEQRDAIDASVSAAAAYVA
jgi:hypothetical protein